MGLSDRDAAFVDEHNSGAMITVGTDGMAKVARVAVAVVDGKLWSSGTEDRVRTRRLRRDPRCTLYVYGPSFPWIGIEADVRILDGEDAPQLNLRLFRKMQGRPTGPISWFGGEYEESRFLQAMADERRIIYEFHVHRVYGMR